MKKLLIVFLLLLLSGCSTDNPYQDTWDSVKDKEFSNSEVFAGEGIYFYEEHNKMYATFMKYGSGVPILAEYTSEITFDEDGNMVMDLPYAFITHQYNNEAFFDSIDQTVFTYSDGTILWGDLIFEVAEISCHDGC